MYEKCCTLEQISQHSESCLETGALSFQLQGKGMQILYEKSAEALNTISYTVFFPSENKNLFFNQ